MGLLIIIATALWIVGTMISWDKIVTFSEIAEHRRMDLSEELGLFGVMLIGWPLFWVITFRRAMRKAPLPPQADKQTGE